MKIVVQKFGGTSVSSEDRRFMVTEKVLEAIADGFMPVVVVSAMGRSGDPYATDTLLSLLDNNFKNDNLQACDLLMSCGEIISTVVMSNDLNKKSIKAVPLLGGQAGIITNSNFSNATVLRVNPEKILEILNEGKVPVVAGFQGLSEDGYLTTLGRGGSDVTASLIGLAIKSKKVEIYTDVDGIMTADPRVVKEASLIEEISYSEVYQFADQGAKVIHPRAVKIAARGNIPLIIKNTLNSSNGTLISATCNDKCNNFIDGITQMDNRVQIKFSASCNDENENYSTILDLLAEDKISIDLINVFPKESIFTIDKNDFIRFDKVTKVLNLKYSCEKNCSKISLIGNKMAGKPGVMAKIVKTLRHENIDVLQTADSHETIWCLVKTDLAHKAVNALHREFCTSSQK
ncbi:aspartate kinase [Clostridium akagii]|uniref:aspartate kinase n=1 Tax=Clostridium akagii TaxID=91623 RepID=UPI000479F7D9|nr:aspartate kinase [Clostridium akagii]